MNTLTFECDHCGIKIMQASSIVSTFELCPRCAKTQLLYDAAHDALEKAQTQLIREWVTYWIAVGVPRDSLLSSDPHLRSCEAIERAIEAISNEVRT